MDRTVDILHPLASLEWREYGGGGPPVSFNNVQALWLKDKVYLGGTVPSDSIRDDIKLYIFTPATDTWTTLDTPVYHFALTTYHSQLVLIGGVEYVSLSRTDKLWTLSEDGQWQETLPPMPAPCTLASAVSHEDHLLVISDNHPNNKVYVYNGHHWANAQHPPQRLTSVKSTLFNGHWYLMGGPFITRIYSASLDSLLASETSQPLSVWKRLTDIPTRSAYPVVFGNRLIAVENGSLSFTISLYAYSSFAQSWVHMGNAPFKMTDVASCAVVLPSKELMIMRGHSAFAITLGVSPFNSESLFNMRAVSLLEAAAGIPVMRTLNTYSHIRLIQIILGLVLTLNLDVNTLLSYWLSDVPHTCIRPTWKNLLLIIRLLNLDELAERMETYLTEKLSPTRGHEQMDEKIRLRDDTIFHLKQQMSTQQHKIEDLNHENEELKTQHSVEGKRDDVTESKHRIWEETILDLKQQMSTMQQRINDLKHENEELKKAQRSLATVKKVKMELKKEAVIAATMSAQPTTATWNLRGVEVCGEMTVVVYSTHEQQITWPGYGLRLHIPKGCLPAGMEQCTINIKASLAGQYEFPENSHLVSAIFWLCCEDVNKFTRPITVEIQHCAKLQNVTNLKLSFVRAVCSQKQLPYTFKQLSEGNFTNHSSYGIIELNSFSGVGVTQEGSEDREYCSQLFYLGQPNCKIHFVVTWNIEAHLTETVSKYEGKGAILGLQQPMEFESDTISLDIPLEGIAIKGWKITPLMRPVVTKKQVDNFREGKLTPCCQLLAEVSGKKKKIPTLKHQVNLKGAKYPNDVFVINLPAGDTNLQERSQTFGDLAAAAGPPPTKKSRIHTDESALFTEPSSSQSLSTTVSGSLAGPSSAAQTHAPKTEAATGLDTKLDLDSVHFKATAYLQKLDKQRVRNVGGALGLSYSSMEKMTSFPDDMVAAWLRREDFVMSMSGEPTWRTLVEALRKVGQEGTARDIEKTETK